MINKRYGFIQKYSIKNKLILIGVVIPAFGLILLGFGMAIMEVKTVKQKMLKELTIQAKIIGDNCTASLTFNDSKSAQETLSALKANTGIDYCILYTKEGKSFAAYQHIDRHKHRFVPVSYIQTNRFGLEYASVYHEITLDGKVVGKIYIQANLDEMYHNLFYYLLFLAIGFLFTLFITYIMYKKLQKSITEPVIKMANTMQAVTVGKDYSIRTPVSSQDELGLLADGFNEMLSQIQMRDSSLEEHRQNLQMLVDQRTGELHKVTDRLVLHFQQLPFAVIEWDMDFRVIDWNPAAERIFGFSKEEAMGKRGEELILIDNKPNIASKVWSSLLAGSGGEYSLNENLTKERRTILCEWHNTRLIDENNHIVGIASVAEDVTEKKQFEQKLEYLAYYDELTGLPNRRLFKDRLELASHMADRNQNIVGIVFMDLDFFKTVNDTLGHGVGDILLQAVASRLKNSFRRSDTVSRFGGDEFAVLIPDLHNAEEIESILQNVYDQFAAPFEILEHVLHVSLSIGYSFYPLDEMDSEMLLRNADAAMYHAKESGRNKYSRYQSEMTSYIQVEFKIQNELISAIKNGEFQLFYQPQMNIKSGVITGAEALIRWNHPDRGIVSPVEFIPIAEKTGLIVPIGEWVLRTACQQLKRWNDEGISPFTMAINLSSRQFKEENFFNKAIEIFHETEVDTNAVELELTESILIEDTAKIFNTLNAFKTFGIRFSLDDFGTGYSSLSYLKHFPISKLKIDQSFVKNITTNGSDRTLVKAIIAMGRALDLTTIAEGVESQEQFDFLREEGCEEIQGYLLGKPMPANQFEVFFNEGKKLL